MYSDENFATAAVSVFLSYAQTEKGGIGAVDLLCVFRQKKV